MAKTLLNSVNDLFRLASLIAGDDAALTSLTDSARQVDIDQAIIALNQTIDELYTSSTIPRVAQQAESTIVLATGTRAYSLATGMVRLHWPLIDKTNNQYIFQYGSGYDGLLILDPEQDDTGLPHWAAIRPTDGKLHLDRAPTSTEDGKTYTYQYDKDLGMSAASDTVPFNDTVYRAVIAAAYQLWKRERRNEFDGDIFKTHFGRAARLLAETAPRRSYNPRT